MISHLLILFCSQPNSLTPFLFQISIWLLPLSPVSLSSTISVLLYWSVFKSVSLVLSILSFLYFSHFYSISLHLIMLLHILLIVFCCSFLRSRLFSVCSHNLIIISVSVVLSLHFHCRFYHIVSIMTLSRSSFFSVLKLVSLPFLKDLSLYNLYNYYYYLFIYVFMHCSVV